MHDLTKFQLPNSLLLGAELRRLGVGAHSLEQVAQRTTELLYGALRDPASGRSACVLARCYKTHAFEALPPDLQQAARTTIPGVEPSPHTRCLTLVGTYGDAEEWRLRQRSVGHRAIPLVSERIVESLPMVAELARSLGLDTTTLVRPDARILLEADRRGFNVFHIRDAERSPYVPAKDAFVKPYGVRSAVGFGFMIPPLDILALILFTRTLIDENTASLFKTLALNLKLAVLPYAGIHTFEPAIA
jgi:hypothetical protein